MKASKKIIMQIRDTNHLLQTLKELSVKQGGCWAFSIMPFTHETHFYKYNNPSSVPDDLHDITHNRLGYKGKIVPFSKSAQVREQNRGYSGDR
jgi:hypothetical protein